MHKEVVMPVQQKKPDNNKRISLHPLSFEEALKGLLQTEPPPKEQKEKPAPKRRKHSIGKASDTHTLQ
jgi:hypothetical protein